MSSLVTSLHPKLGAPCPEPFYANLMFILWATEAHFIVPHPGAPSLGCCPGSHSWSDMSLCWAYAKGLGAKACRPQGAHERDLGQLPGMDSDKTVSRVVTVVSGFCHCPPLSLGSISSPSFSQSQPQPRLEFADSELIRPPGCSLPGVSILHRISHSVVSTSAASSNPLRSFQQFPCPGAPQTQWF